MANVGRWEQVEITWIDDKTDCVEAIATMFCPVCQTYSSKAYFYGDPTDGMNYCPRCGDQMKGGEDDD